MELKSHIGLRIVFGFALVAAVAFILMSRNREGSQIVRVASPIKAEDPLPTGTVAIINPVTREENTSQPSPDGKRRLTLKKSSNLDSTFSYTLTTTDGSGESVFTTYSATLGASEELKIPFNAWSPDNRYFFIQKNGDAMLFKASGEEMSAGQPFWEIGRLFAEAGINNTFQEVTGWASETLLIVNTRNPEGAEGSSFWFEVTSNSFLPLSFRY